MSHKNSPHNESKDDSLPSGHSVLEESHPSNEKRKSRKPNHTKTKKWLTPEKMTCLFTGIIAAWTIVYSVFAGLQWLEIRGGSTDTHALAVAAKIQAEQSQAQTLKMKESLERTDKLIKANFGILSTARKQADAARSTANAAKKSADIAEKTMVSTHRPWVSVSLHIGSGFTFNEQGGNITIVFRMKNIGNSPAVGTHINAEAIIGFGPNDAIVKQKTMIAAARKYSGPIASSFGQMLFPGDEITEAITFQMSREYIKKSETKAGKNIIPYIVGCVVYGFSFDESVHKTGFIGQVLQIDPLYPNSRLVINPMAGDVPINLLTLTHAFTFGGYAD
jgi:hypothetical protein